MQEPPLPPGSAWLAKAWNEQFELGALCADVQTFPGDVPLLCFSATTYLLSMRLLRWPATGRSVTHAARQMWF